MITYKKEIETFDELKELCWSGASDRLDEIEELGLQDEFMKYLTSMFEYTPDMWITETDINDFIWFECDDWIEQHKEKGEEE